jgi:hypothetical protein
LTATTTHKKINRNTKESGKKTLEELDRDIFRNLISTFFFVLLTPSRFLPLHLFPFSSFVSFLPPFLAFFLTPFSFEGARHPHVRGRHVERN